MHSYCYDKCHSYLYVYLLQLIHSCFLQRSSVCLWFTTSGRGLFSWVCVLKSAFRSVPFLVWCHCGLPRGRVAPLDWWCWQSICTNRESVTFLDSFYFFERFYELGCLYSTNYLFILKFFSLLPTAVFVCLHTILNVFYDVEEKGHPMSV